MPIARFAHRLAIHCHTMPGQAPLDRAAVHERLCLELLELDYDAQATFGGVNFTAPSGTRFFQVGSSYLVRSGRVAFQSDASGRHLLRAELEVSPLGILYCILGLSIPYFFLKLEWDSTLRSWRDTYLTARAPAKRLVRGTVPER